MEALTVLFAILFVAQTAIFITLYRRAVTRHDITEREAPKPAVKPEEVPVEKSGALHESTLKALKLIKEGGNVTSSDVSRGLGLSREHTARVMKSLHEKGYVSRTGKPFRYSLTALGEKVLREAGG